MMSGWSCLGLPHLSTAVRFGGDQCILDVSHVPVTAHFVEFQRHLSALSSMLNRKGLPVNASTFDFSPLLMYFPYLRKAGSKQTWL